MGIIKWINSKFKSEDSPKGGNMSGTAKRTFLTSANKSLQKSDKLSEFPVGPVVLEKTGDSIIKTVVAMQQAGSVKVVTTLFDEDQNVLTSEEVMKHGSVLRLNEEGTKYEIVNNPK